MSRIVVHAATGPAEVKTKKGDSVWICRCGLTDNEDGTCSSNHKKFKVADEDPNQLYQYDKDGKRHQLAKDGCGEDCCMDEDDDAKKESGCCGGCGGCCRDED